MADDQSDYHGRFLSFDACEQAASIIRDRLGLDDIQGVPSISSVLFMLGFECVVRSEDSMSGQEAFAIPEEKEIHFRQDVFERVLDDQDDARFVGLHEVAHGLVHEGPQRYFKMTDGNVLLPFASEDESTETHADRIARAVLMPKKMVEQCNGVLDLAKRARVPVKEASARLHDLLSRSIRALPSSAAEAIDQFRVASAKGSAAQTKAKAEHLKAQLWRALPMIEGEDPSFNRACEGYWIRWDQFGKMTECGWFIEGDAARSWFASRHR